MQLIKFNKNETIEKKHTKITITSSHEKVNERDDESTELHPFLKVNELFVIICRWVVELRPTVCLWDLSL